MSDGMRAWVQPPGGEVIELLLEDGMSREPVDRLAVAEAENQRKRRDCPNRDAHMPTPDRPRFYHQSACPSCGLFVIWAPKDRSTTSSDSSGGTV